MSHPMHQPVVRRRDLLKGAALLGGAAAVASLPQIARANEASVASGTYRGTAAGRSGDVTVEVYCDRGCVLSIDVVESSETATISDYAIERVGADIVRYQTLGVDTVAGATLTSLAVINAVRNALGDGVLGEEAAAYPPVEAADCACDVVVVGAGSAGMLAALEAAEGGANVILVEKQGIFGGGDTMFASSGLAGGGGYTVYKNAIEDAAEQDYLDLKTATAEKSGLPVDLANLEAYSLLSGEAVDRYIGLGVPFGRWANFSNTIDDGSSPGTHIVKRLAEAMERKGIDVRLNTKLTSIVMDGSRAAGVVVQNSAGSYTIGAPAVILASGGFGYNEDMLAEYANAASYNGLPHSGAVSAKGEGILAAKEIGAALSNMTAIKANNVCHVASNGAVISLAVVQSVAALVNDEGQRFVSESNTTIGEKSEAELQQPNQEAWAIFDQALVDQKALLRGYDALGYFVHGDTWEELGAAMGLDEAGTAHLSEALTAWQELGEGAEDPAFGGKVINGFTQPPYYAALVKPAMQSTYGGVTTDPCARVLREDGTPIAGLYAAGAVSGHGCFGNVVGNGLTIASTFGLIAARTALEELA